MRSSLQLQSELAPSRRPNHVMHAFLAEVRYELIANWRQLDFAMPTVLFPAFFYLFFGVFFGKGSGLATYLVATYGAFGVIGTGLLGFGVGIAVARESGELRLKRVTPAPPAALIGARLVTALWFSAFILFELFVLAAVLADVRFERGQWLALAIILLIGTLPFGALGLAIGTRVSAKGAPAIINLLYLPSAFLSGLWIPITMLPEFLQQLALFMPPYHLAQLALGVIGLDAGHPWQLHVGVLAGITVVAGIVAMRGIRR